ncbi:E3 ubiquitin ligase BIG BROTHER-like isoform X4 [Cynara cardunculus var. scolymus]|uniref:E3 ubiquitin ligase BIG BROTHER-like isoform X4 n=1 Tax=Cynara cardunculus var. scolymus TaxID=59895 RepID=UPI000D62BD4C|nr:E3 ubiquitin ligase BIG BROTHER-like isoform X4 [Cynara cardunculus var. scolymus]
MSRDVDVHEHYLNGTLPADIAENLNDFLPEEEGLCYEEVILQQASVYESIQEYGRNRVVASDDHPSRDSSVSSEDEGITESPVATPTAPSSDLRQDDIDPDNMQYEELVNLTESVGVENRGLSESHISRLPTSIYTSRMFSKNKEEKLCVVCQENFKFGKRLITLPCSHQYHSECIIDWLKIKKICPMCQKEVI